MLPSDSNPTVAACIDIGGTKALLGLVNRKGVLLASEKFLVAPRQEPIALVVDLAARLRSLAERSQVDWASVRGLGYSTTGMMDVKSGIVFASLNQGSWRDIRLKELLETATGLPTRIEMDANAAALGEAWLGTGKDADPFVYLVVGTGIGAGILSKGCVLRGWRGTAGEIGHTVIDLDGPPCNCGGRGCLESLASGPAIALRARHLLENGRVSRMTDLCQPSELSAETVFQAARLWDEAALEIVDQTVRYLSIGLTNLIHLLNPRIIALGGGVALGGADLLLEPLRQAVTRRVGSWVDMGGTAITLSQLGNEAGLMGAAWLVWNHLDKDL